MARHPRRDPAAAWMRGWGFVGFCQLPWLRDTAVRQAWGPGGACCGTGRLRAEVVRPWDAPRLPAGLRGEPAGGACRLDSGVGAAVCRAAPKPSGWAASGAVDGQTRGQELRPFPIKSYAYSLVVP